MCCITPRGGIEIPTEPGGIPTRLKWGSGSRLCLFGYGRVLGGERRAREGREIRRIEAMMPLWRLVPSALLGTPKQPPETQSAHFFQ